MTWQRGGGVGLAEVCAGVRTGGNSLASHRPSPTGLPPLLSLERNPGPTSRRNFAKGTQHSLTQWDAGGRQEVVSNSATYDLLELVFPS
ncbi:uncharacterized protein N7446_005036 [Penicillium canescens]|uniref:uncharacterized protein n=1 Tax=Penicillium canescens TaxID=5083 RepID=UPI0026E01958|nr:uncharacterized protein N7446_005036 [Penicillium canescens]KAJ6039652.1 hypothetical protein N7444_008557 [Penicillium canescens]KAJ6067999.1 hypothetical protein N7446_005036 [Penicillium canescens]